MKSIFEDLDTLIEQAVKKATESEKSLQHKQSQLVKKKGLEAEVKDEKVEEAEDEEEPKKNKDNDESIPKIRGKSSADEPSSEKGTEKTEKPGTKTSKKLQDPSEKTISDPQFSDVRDKVNALRSTSSLSNPEVSTSVKKYLTTLSKAEKGALLTYLTNLAQIMAPVKSATQVKDPGEAGIKITFKDKSKSDKNDKTGKADEKVANKKSAKSDVIVVGEK
jgi:hypothetical protein